MRFRDTLNMVQIIPEWGQPQDIMNTLGVGLILGLAGAGPRTRAADRGT